jgi:hypothetical protein
MRAASGEINGVAGFACGDLLGSSALSHMLQLVSLYSRFRHIAAARLVAIAVAIRGKADIRP